MNKYAEFGKAFMLCLNMLFNFIDACLKNDDVRNSTDQTKISMRNKNFLNIMLVILAIVITSVLVQGYISLKSGFFDVASNLYYYTIVIICTLIVVFSVYKKWRSLSLFLVVVLISFGSVKFYFRYIAHKQLSFAMEKAALLINEIDSFYKINNRYPATLNDLSLKNNLFYYKGFLPYHYGYAKTDSSYEINFIYYNGYIHKYLSSKSKWVIMD